MNISKNLVHAFLGIFLGNFIAVAILMLSKHEDYMRFWNWGGFIIFPFIILIIFILMLGIYILINKFFKINFTIPSTHFSTIGGLFGFFYILGEFFIINPFVNKIGGNIMVEDAGFFVEALNEFPGVYSSYVMKMIGNEGILKLLGNSSNRKAKFKAVVAYYSTEHQIIHYFKGDVRGNVSFKIRGNNGFGFDPIFIPDKMPDKTFGEISIDIKNKISHRSEAIIKLGDFLKSEGY